MQFLSAVPRRLVVHDFAHGLARLCRNRLALTIGNFAGLQLGHAAGFFLGAALAVFLIAAAAALFLEFFLIQALFFEPVALRALERGLGLLLGLADLVDLFLLMPRLILEYFALDVGAFAAHLDVHGASTALRDWRASVRIATCGAR